MKNLNQTGKMIFEQIGRNVETKAINKGSFFCNFCNVVSVFGGSKNYCSEKSFVVACGRVWLHVVACGCLWSRVVACGRMWLCSC